jgi:hypothetical protein
MGSGVFAGLPAELQVMVVAAMDSGARIADWVSVLNTSKETRGAVSTAFGDWVAAQPYGVSFGRFGGAKSEAQFIVDFIDGKALRIA